MRVNVLHQVSHMINQLTVWVELSEVSWFEIWGKNVRPLTSYSKNYLY